MRIAMAVMTTLIVMLGGVAAASARTWYILPDGSGQAATIQAGIDSAAAGDTVLLAAGTYTGVGNRDIGFLGKVITVTSESGRDMTVVDCQELGGGFTLASSSILSGLTIRNASSYAVGGVYCPIGMSATISNNTIIGNRSDFCGGIYCDVASSPTISGNTISWNYNSGIVCDHLSSPVISGNTITGNYGYNGGGIFCYLGSTATISNNTICGNRADYGGGICCYPQSSPYISNTIVAFNTQGGGIHCFGGLERYPTFTNCDIFGNVGGDGFCGTDGGGNISVDPLFCDRGSGNFMLCAGSPCVNNPGYGQIGAFGVGCGYTPVQSTTWGRIKNTFR